MQALFVHVAPIIQARVARALLRRSRTSSRDPRQELRDMVQEVFVSLLADDGKTLRAWRAERGMSLENFVGLVAERQVASILRTGKRSPWKDEPVDDADLTLHAGSSDADGMAALSRDMLQVLLERLEEELTPKMLLLFRALWVEERPVAEICGMMEMQPDAVYAARSRITKRARAIAAELEREMSDSGRHET
jgi:DNA-directed RNA polymerase specialized sigma24 family protein